MRNIEAGGSVGKGDPVLVAKALDRGKAKGAVEVVSRPC